MLNIKRHISLLAIYSAIAILHGVVLASCTNDDAIGDTDDKVSDSEIASYYMAVKIYDTTDGAPLDATSDVPSFDSNFSDVEGEDGNIFNKGLHEEKAIYSNYEKGIHNFIMLFDEKDEKVGDLLHLKPFSFEDPENPAKEEEDNTSYSLFVATLNKDDVLRKGIKKVLVVLNASPSIRTKLNNLTTYGSIYELKMTETDATNTDFLYLDVKEDGTTTRYFTMSSSMVVKKTDAAGNKSVEAATKDERPLELHLHETKAEALEDPYVMYIERTQSKYTVLFKKGDNKQYYFDSASTESSEDLEYIPEKSSLEYVSGEDFTPTDPNIQSGLRYVKDYTRGASVNNRGDVTVKVGSWKVNITGWGVNGLEKNEYLFKQIDSNTNYFDGWESSKYTYRNFWAEDLNYTTGIYPDQYREVLGWNDKNELEPDLSVKTGIEDATLNYFSFIDLQQKEPHQYSPENTFNASVFGDKLTEAFESKAFLRVGTHLIVTAELLIEGIDYGTGANTTTVADKLYMNGIYWTEAAYKEYVAEYLAYWMLTETNQEKFGPNDGIFYVQDNNGIRPAKGGDFELKAANIKGGDGWVYLSPKIDLYTKNGTTKIDKDQYMTLAYEHQDLMAGHFTKGYMYYAVPVEHNKREGKNPIIATGDYGAVRNHWYAFTVTNINSVGIPVDKPDQPIVPNAEPKNPGLGVEVKILNWHQVSTDVNISDQRPNK